MARPRASPGAASPAAAAPGGWRGSSKLDRLLTNPWTAFPIMVAVLGAMLWLTIVGANVPSGMLATLLVDKGHALLIGWFVAAGAPGWLKGLVVDGMYLATAWVIAVMLPPMAIFFPCFTLLEDFGFLPRVAFNLDRIFQKVGAHGKQALTMAMGLGCNAAGVVATRIIDSPRERLIAILTNNFSLCNGRWPTQILMATVFIGTLAPEGWARLDRRALGAGRRVVGIRLRDAHFLAAGPHGAARRGHHVQPRTAALPPAEFLENPLHLAHRPHAHRAVARGGVRPARRGRHLAGREHPRRVISASPRGSCTPPIRWPGSMGLTGVILLAYIVAIPANEIVVPTILMLTVLVTGAAGGAGAGVMFEADDDTVRAILTAGGWTTLTAVCLMLFSLCHNPCSTTLYTIYQETRSVKWTAVSALLPLLIGFVLCAIVAAVWRAVG